MLRKAKFERMKDVSAIFQLGVNANKLFRIKKLLWSNVLYTFNINQFY